MIVIVLAFLLFSTSPVVGNALLMESGDSLLLESGDRILLDETNRILTESSDGLLTESSDNLVLDDPTPTFTTYYATPSGSGLACTQGAPCSLSTVCGGNSPADPGDLILLDGTFHGRFTCSLSGSSGHAITIKPLNRGSAILDGYVTTTLSSSMDATQCDFSVADGTSFPTGATFRVDAEYINILTKSGTNNITGCQRGYSFGSASTTPASHASGATITLLGDTLTVSGDYLDIREVEIQNSDPNRDWPSTTFVHRGEGVMVQGDHLKFVNLVLHDNQDSMFFSASAEYTEVIGLLIFNNGNVDSTRSHGHGLYVQNQGEDHGSSSTKLIRDVITLNNFATGLKGFSETGYVDNITFSNIISANNGSSANYTGNAAGYSSTHRWTGIEIGTGSNGPQDNVVTNSSVWYPETASIEGGCLFLGYASTGDGLTVTDNICAGGYPTLHFYKMLNAVVENNVFVQGSTDGTLIEATIDEPTSTTLGNNTYFDLKSLFDNSRFSINLTMSGVNNCCHNRLAGGILEWSSASAASPANTEAIGGSGSGFKQWSGWESGGSYTGGSFPTTNVIRVYPNPEEVGRANIAIFNWEGTATPNVNISSAGLTHGDAYCIFDAQNWQDWDCAHALVTGTYNSGSPTVGIPLSGLTTVRDAIGSAFDPGHTANAGAAKGFFVGILRKVP